MKILIWGTGVLATHYMKFDYFSGHEILGFVDSYKTEKNFMGYSIYKPNQIANMDYDCLLICVVKDNAAILKTCIAENVDLRKVCILSKNTEFEGVGSKYIQQLLNLEDVRDMFPVIYRGRMEKQKKEKYYCNSLEQELNDYALIQSLGENHVIAWIPIELLFSERTEDNYLDVYTKEWMIQNKRWENLPLISFRPYRDLFLFFMQGLHYPTAYCEWYQKLFISRGEQSGYTDEQLVEKRFREFKVMQHELNRGMDFFIAHPAAAKWNPKGYFNLIDGHHRTAFLYYSGLVRMPVQITRKDYELWCNKKTADSVQDIILKQKRTEFYQPILNPYFLSLHSYREEHAKSRLHHLLETFGDKRFIGKKVIDIGANLGYMGQEFCRMGAEVTLLEPDNIHYELTREINDLLYTKCDVVTLKFEEYETEKVFDIAILLTVFYHYFSNETVRAQFIQRLNKNVSQMIIWESGNMPNDEKKYIMEHTRFQHYRHICYTYATGKFREMGIFIASDSEYL